MSKSFFLLTAFGKDHPGIVARVTGVVFDLGGTIEDASMTRLGGEFTMMLVIGLPGSTAGHKMGRRLTALQNSLSLTLSVKPIASALACRRRHAEATHMISVYGTDKPGIVYRVTKTLADRRVNITDLNTRVLQRSGKPLYMMFLEVQIASPNKARALEKVLARLGRDLRLAVTLQHMEAVSL